MNGDMSCIKCEKTIPRAAEYGHLLDVHGWDYDKYRKRYCPTILTCQIDDFEGYNPIVISPKYKGVKKLAIFIYYLPQWRDIFPLK